MTDRELLERAAKAAGIAVQWPITKPGATPFAMLESSLTNTVPTFWSPLTDDGDALRLAVKLRMCVEAWGSGASAVVFLGSRALVAEPHYGDDPERATRRAIVRAAAAMAEEGQR